MLFPGGRYILGIGLGYRDEEFEMAGVLKSTRLSRFTESIDVIRQLWRNDTVAFDGRHFRLTNVGTSPKPLQEADARSGLQP